MSLSINLLKADRIGVRDLREHLSARLKRNKPLIVTDHGNPTKVIISYSDLLEIIEVLDELQDAEVLRTIQEGRAAVKTGAKGIPVSNLFQKIRSRR